MGPLFYVMAILGCGDSETMCDQLRIEPTRYASAAACEAATADALGASGDVDYPVVIARCSAAGAAMAEAKAGGPRS